MTLPTKITKKSFLPDVLEARLFVECPILRPEFLFAKLQVFWKKLKKNRGKIRIDLQFRIFNIYLIRIFEPEFLQPAFRYKNVLNLFLTNGQASDENDHCEYFIKVFQNEIYNMSSNTNR